MPSVFAEVLSSRCPLHREIPGDICKALLWKSPKCQLQSLTLHWRTLQETQITNVMFLSKVFGGILPFNLLSTYCYDCLVGTYKMNDNFTWHPFCSI